MDKRHSPHKLECWQRFKDEDPKPMTIKEIIQDYEEWSDICNG